MLRRPTRDAPCALEKLSRSAAKQSILSGHDNPMNSPAPSSVVVDSCRRLVSRLAPHVVGASSPASPLRPQRSDIYIGTPQETRMLQLCLRLLSSRLAAGSIVDEIIVTEKLKKQASLQKDSRASLQLQDYLGRLKQKHVLNRRLQVLCVLANLSFSLDSSSASYVQYPAYLRSCLTCVFPCAGTSRSRFQRCLPLHSDWMSLFLLL